MVVIGFVFANTYYHIPLEDAVLMSLLFSLFVFEFIIYQARYQIHDIRGISEDKEAGHTDRLLSGDEENIGRRIKLSFGIAIVKINYCDYSYSYIWRRYKDILTYKFRDCFVIYHIL